MTNPMLAYYQKSLADHAGRIPEPPTDVCPYCEKTMRRSEGLVPDEDGAVGQMMHLQCSVEEADNVGFDGWVQDNG